MHNPQPRSQSTPLRLHCFLALAALILALPLAAQPIAWTSVPDSAIPAARGLPSIRPEGTPRFHLDTDILRAELTAVPAEGTAEAKGHEQSPCRVALPLPDGTFADFHVFDAPVMAPELAARYPELRTYRVVAVDNPTFTGRIDLTPKGFHGQFYEPAGPSGHVSMFYIDPIFHIENKYHTVYRRHDLAPSSLRPEGSFKCTCPTCVDLRELRNNSTAPQPQPEDGATQLENDEPQAPGPAVPQAASTPSARTVPTATAPAANTGYGTNLRTFRLAMSATGEFTQFQGGTVIDTMAAIVAGLNRLNGIFEREMAVTFRLVTNNDLIIFIDPDTDPFEVQGSFENVLENQEAIDGLIGFPNYDVGHNLQIGAGGFGPGRICSVEKAMGYTGLESPVGDPFWIDYVAHELGHQFGAFHTWNSIEFGSCNPFGRSEVSAYEPGSASTIMGYAGICGSDNIQRNSDPYFHAVSIAEMQATITSNGTCSVSSPTGNSIPVVEAGPPSAIPASTPFELTASGFDANPSDPLFYCWEQYDLGPPTPLGATDNGVSPLFRSYIPTASSTRIFPQLDDILLNRNSIAEVLPTTDRTLTFRCTIRDQRTERGIGASNHDDRTLTVVADAGPFRVTFANNDFNAAGTMPVTWDVAGTTASPINCSGVDIFLSTDGGETFPIQLADNVPNTGSADVEFPQILERNARIKIKCANNVFFDINDSDFTIQPGSGAATFALADDIPTMIDDATGSGNTNQIAEPGESNLQLTINLRNIGNVPAQGISAVLSTTDPRVTILSQNASYPNLQPNETSFNQQPFVISLGADITCGLEVPLLLTVTSDQGVSSIFVPLPTGQRITVPVPPASYRNQIPVLIPDADFTTGAVVTIPIQLNTTIADLNVFIGGGACNSAQTVGIAHSYISDLIILLTSPSGTTITLFNRPAGSGFGAQGPNLCNMMLDDQGGGAPISSLPDFGPYDNTYTPEEPLSAFNGEPISGDWVINAFDVFPRDTGFIQDIRLVFTAATTCGYPIGNEGDSDADGLPDTWETEIFGNLIQSASGDPDNDRFTNLEEYIAGTDADDASAFLAFAAAAENQTAYQFMTNADRYYALEKLSNLETETWTQVGNVFRGTGGLISVPAQGTPPMTFHRIRVQLTPDTPAK